MTRGRLVLEHLMATPPAAPIQTPLLPRGVPPAHLAPAVRAPPQDPCAHPSGIMNRSLRASKIRRSRGTARDNGDRSKRGGSWPTPPLSGHEDLVHAIANDADYAICLDNTCSRRGGGGPSRPGSEAYAAASALPLRAQHAKFIEAVLR